MLRVSLGEMQQVAPNTWEGNLESVSFKVPIRISTGSTEKEFLVSTGPRKIGEGRTRNVEGIGVVVTLKFGIPEVSTKAIPVNLLRETQGDKSKYELFWYPD